MMRSCQRFISTNIFSNSFIFFSHHSLGSMAPPPSYTLLPKIGAFKGSYEVFHDFAIDSILSISSYGSGLGASIIFFSIAMRCLFSPFIVLSQINSMKMQLLYPEQSRFREEMAYAYRTRDSVKIQLLNESIKALRRKYNINHSVGAISLLQLPLVISFYFTISDMVARNDLFPGMELEGFLWFANLTIPDPYYLLPLGLGISGFLSIHMNPAILNQHDPQAVVMKYMRFVPLLGIPITANFPAAIVLNWFIMSSFQLIVNSSLHSEKGKKLAGIPKYLPGSILEKFHAQLNAKKEFNEADLFKK